MAEEKTCFIIMPITTPDSVIESYRDKDEHFAHVLDCLFKPAVHKAGYKPIPPIAKGSDLIHAGIIKNLEASDMVLCDMSSLNPNVFFEFGIRTSLNKPVCVVKDELTTTVPFDTGIINHHEYQSSLETWLIKSEIERLSDHIIASDKRSKGQNTLWKYFGLKSEAVPFKGEEGVEAKIDYLTMQFDSLRGSLESVARHHDQPSDDMLVDIGYTIKTLLPDETHPTWSIRPSEKSVLINYQGKIPDGCLHQLIKKIHGQYNLVPHIVRRNRD